MTDSQLAGQKGMNAGCTAIVSFIRTEERSDVDEPVETRIIDSGVPKKENIEKSETKTIPNSNSSIPDVRNKRRRVLYTANVGDARAVLCRNGCAIRLSYDHKGSDRDEAQRIKNHGGFVMNNRVNGILAVTRSLGDISMKEWIIGNPFTTETVLYEADSFIILACDGVWDVCSDQTAVDIIKDIDDPQQASETLLAFALDNFSTDNLSVLVVRLDKQFWDVDSMEL
ncbi:Protein phosphatase 2C 1 [Nowakowskiella sp. JEL0078]|nr:Protein phosphatase 2C 1 [Nowakowskiella sp. JEL0078]